MNTCPNCGKTLSEDEKLIYRCLSCNQKIKFISDEPIYKTSSVSKNLCTFLICLFSIIGIISLFIFLDSNDEYTIEKGRVAVEKVDKIQSNIWNLNPDINDSELKDLILKRNICVIFASISIISIVICCIILYSHKNKPTPRASYIAQMNSNMQNKTSKEKLQELEQLFTSNLITEEEYNLKRKDIIDKL